MKTARIIRKSTALTALLLLAGCEREPPAGTTVPPAGDYPFEEIAEATGLTFTHFNGATGAYYQPEVFGPGVALLDYDADGDLSHPVHVHRSAP